MDAGGQKNSLVGKLRVRGAGFDPLATRLNFERLFGLDGFLSDHLPPGALVCIKKISDPKPRLLRLTPADWRFSEKWRRAVAREVENFYRRAFRPARDVVPAQAESVVFADRAELLACLASDFCRGKLAENWWWRGLFPNLGGAQTVIKIWLDAAEFAPPAFQILAKTGDAVRFVKKLQPAETKDLLRRIVEIFGLQKLASALFEPPATKTKVDAETLTARRAKENLFFGLEARVSVMSETVFGKLMPEIKTADLNFEQRTLLETVLLLAGAPRIARSAEFARKVRIYRLKNEFGNVVAIKKHKDFSAQKTVLERNSETPTRVTRKRRGNNEDEINQPKAVRTKLHFFTPETSENVENSSGIPKAAKRTPEKQETPAIEAKRDREITQERSKIEFENAKPEEQTEKIASKKRLKSKPATEPAKAKTAFENYFEDFEPSVEDSFQTRYGGIFYLLNLGLYLGLYRDFTESSQADIDLDIWDFIALLGLRFLGEQIKRDAVWDFLKSKAARGGDDDDASNEFGRKFERRRDWRMPLFWLETFPKNQRWSWKLTKKRLVIRHAEGFNVVDAARRGAAENQLEKEAEVYRGLFSEIEMAEETAPLKSQNWLKNLTEYLEKRLCQALGLDGCDELNAVLFEHRASVVVSATHLDITFSLADLPLEVRFAGIDRDPGWIPAAGKFVYFHFV
jgi:hypothetical protein